MTPSEPATPADPTKYRRKGFGLIFWAAIAFGFACIAAGVFIGLGYARIFPTEPKTASQVIAPVRPTGALPVESPVAAPLPAESPPSASPAAPGDLGGLTRRVQKLESDQIRTAEAATAALATAALIQATQTSRPFAQELAAIERRLPGRPELVQLRALAARGAPTRAVLAADFSGYASQGIGASRKPDADSSLMDRVRYWLAGVITIRRIDRTEGSGVNAVLTRAEQRVHDGDIEGALTELAVLPPAALEAMDPWIQSARRRVEIDLRIAAMRDDALQTLGAALGPVA